MMDILSTLQIDIFLTENNKPKPKTVNAPMEITLDDDCENFVNMTMEYERPMTADKNPTVDATPSEVVREVSLKSQTRKRPFHQSPGLPYLASRQEPAINSSLAKEMLLVSEKAKQDTYVDQEIIDTPESSNSNASDMSNHDLSIPMTPERTSTPKPSLHSCKFCHKEILLKFQLLRHERMCAKKQTYDGRDVWSNGESLNNSGASFSASGSAAESFQILECHWCKKKCSSEEELSMHECVENNLDIKNESIDFNDFTSSSIGSGFSSPGTSTRSLDDIRLAISTASKKMSFKLNRSLPYTKNKYKLVKRAPLNATAPAASNIEAGPSKIIQISTAEGSKRQLLMNVPASEIISDLNQNVRSDQLQIKTEITTDKAANRQQFDCPMCDIKRTDLQHVENIHFKMRRTLKNENFWRCSNCTKMVAKRSLILSHAISCGLKNEAARPSPKPSTFKSTMGTACTSCGGRKGIISGKRKVKCGRCEPCHSPKCGQCKFCLKPSFRKACVNRVCRQMVNRKCDCPSKPKQN